MKYNLILILLVLFLIPTNVLANNKLSEEYNLNLYKAKVIEIVEIEKREDSTTQNLKIEILDRDYNGLETIITNTVTDNSYGFLLKENDKISVHMELEDNEPRFYFHNFDRTNYLVWLGLLFIIFVIILGGINGLKALVALLITISLIFFGLVPLLLQGFSPIFLSVLTCVIATICTFLITTGFNKKTLAAIIGTSGGLVIGGIIAYLFGYFARTTGFSSENAQMLQYLPLDITFDFRGLLFAGIIIGALGACMDVSISISSALTEIKSHKPHIKVKELIKSGFLIGKDIMGTMINTLVLAYTGGSLATILIFSGFNKSISEIINLDSISSEIVRAIAGSMGLLFAIPLTIFAFTFIHKVEFHEKDN